MSDAFADLWSSTGASKPTQPLRNLGSMASTPQAAPKKPQNDVFSMLAAAGSSTNSSRSMTPSYTPVSSQNSGAKPIAKAASTGNDAFSGLLSGSLAASGSANGANLTMAQRAARAEQEKRERLQQTAAPQPVSSAWAGLDFLASTAPHTSPATTSHLDDFDFSPPPPKSTPPRTSQRQQPAPQDEWGDLGAPARRKPPPASSSTRLTDLLDLDDFSSPSDVPARSTPPAPTRNADPTDDFDFGTREDGLLDTRSDDEDDILGDLGKPVDQIAARRTTSASPQPPASGQRSRAVSPPPHILGQIVEMGFSVQQARVALAATDTGLDVQAALETLLANGAASSSPPPEPQEQRRRPQREPGHERYYSSDEEAAPRRRPAPSRQNTGRGGARQSDRDSNARERESPNGTGDVQRNIQDQADKLLAQASEIGLSVFNRANALWSQGKERVQKAYEERAAANGSPASGSSAQPRDGRPKWMQDAPSEGQRKRPDPEEQPKVLFSDDHDQEPPPQRANKAKPPPRQPSPPASSPAQRMREGNLFGDDTPAVYVSPFRRKAGAGRTPAANDAPAQATPKATPPRAPSPVALTQRNAVSAPASAIAASAKHKAAGSEKFKLGQYADADALYTSALAALPDAHLLRVPLLNNRALARLRTGDHAGAAADCSAVVALIGAGYHPAREAKVARADEGAEVDLADALLKAYRRRAEAHEGREKWEDARRDWEAVAGADFAGRLRAEAVRGVGRCRRMLSAGADGAPTPRAAPPKANPKPKPRPRPVQRGPTPPSEALNRVRAATEAAEAEDQQKHDLKDVVDARLVTWKAGKENNIRALIASLDTVLWPDLGWQKVGNHELVSPSQVKIRYTKAIAKLHPDKLNVENTTLEQRMIANGVFGSLNDAWNAFKP